MKIIIKIYERTSSGFSGNMVRKIRYRTFDWNENMEKERKIASEK